MNILKDYQEHWDHAYRIYVGSTSQSGHGHYDLLSWDYGL